MLFSKWTIRFVSVQKNRPNVVIVPCRVSRCRLVDAHGKRAPPTWPSHDTDTNIRHVSALTIRSHTAGLLFLVNAAVLGKKKKKARPKSQSDPKKACTRHTRRTPSRQCFSLTNNWQKKNKEIVACVVVVCSACGSVSRRLIHTELSNQNSYKSNNPSKILDFSRRLTDPQALVVCMFLFHCFPRADSRRRRPRSCWAGRCRRRRSKTMRDRGRLKRRPRNATGTRRLGPCTGGRRGRALRAAK
nr:hypothetical protein [Pandoravirus massiliensis]